ncbi:PHP domain-containing protein [Lachnospiraceae bacterium ASD3451]|uniref:PHP domain-containing protein n=1 Tax=Diplocloster agilis TaxID=2850323 RepID=UPI001D90BF31|nr:PHP domain-containing protein [Diplocloster agilis]MBU9746771.1 PHP domain-containing protein [Diplocloster agilis]
MDRIENLIENLNHAQREVRLQAVRDLKQAVDHGDIPSVPRQDECNNHVHSQYSFSPYSPSKIAWKAYTVGLTTCGIVDHESVAGCLEFKEACAILGVIPTVGFEVRLNWDNTPLKGKKFNNPDQLSVGYFPVHGVPISSLGKIEEFLVPIREAREIRNRAMVKKVDAILSNYGMNLDFDAHVIPVSRWKEKGTITERHLLFATGQRMIEKYGRGQALVDFLEKKLEIPLSGKVKEYLLDTASPIYDYDLTNLLKGFFSENMYVPANAQETPDVEKTIPFLNSLGCIPTYTYLGDVRGESVTGDKKTQKFEDDILDDLFKYVSEYGMQGFSYAPSRNSEDQVKRVRDLCARYNMLEVCGEDINQPRQPFINTTLTAEEKKYFDDVAWAIIGHEKVADGALERGILSEETKRKYPSVQERIRVFREYVTNSQC